MAGAERIGHVRCWLCGSDKAGVSISKAGMCVVTCNACHAQTFARGNYADTMVRQGMKPIARAVAEAVVQIGHEGKVSQAEPAPEKPTSTPAASAVEVEKAPEPKPAKRGFGFFAEV